nr:hypothetical protein [Tanacetum cinerariifolium]
MDAHIPNLQLKLLCILPNVTFHVHNKKECQTLQSVVSNDELNQFMNQATTFKRNILCRIRVTESNIATNSDVCVNILDQICQISELCSWMVLQFENTFEGYSDAIEYHHQQPPQKTRTPSPCVSSSHMATPESSVGKRNPQLEKMKRMEDLIKGIEQRCLDIIDQDEDDIPDPPSQRGVCWSEAAEERGFKICVELCMWNMCHGNSLLYHEGMFIQSGRKSVPGIVAVNGENGKKDYSVLTNMEHGNSLLYHEGMSILSGRKSVPGIVAVNGENGKENYSVLT